jgi:uncharacterized BrkB/YihY/UPF0761 family membrane protein
MFKELRKIWNDTVINPRTGRYSITSLQVAFATLLCFIFSIPHAVECHIWPEQSFNLIPPPDWLIYAWMAVAFGFAGLSQYGKNQARKIEENEPINNTENE